MIEQTAEEKMMKEDFHYREIQSWAIDMVEGGLDNFKYEMVLGLDGKPFWSVWFFSPWSGTVNINKYTKNGFEMMNLVHDAFINGRK